MLDHEDIYGRLRSFDFGRRGGFGKRGSNAATNPEPELKFVGGSIEIEEPMRYNEDFSFVTKAQRLDEWSGELKDEVLGVIMRVFGPDGEVVFEHKDKRVEKIEWQGLPVDEPEFGFSIKPFDAG
jgi:hypothetical protein